MKNLIKSFIAIAVAVLGISALNAANWYVEASPTYMQTSQNYANPEVGGIIDTGKQETKQYGATIAVGYQFNAWHQVQLDVGYLTASTADLSDVATLYPNGGRLTAADFSIDLKTTTIPVLATYNFTWQFAKAWTVKVGPTVGYTYMKTKDDEESMNESALSYGGNVALKWDVSSKVYVQAGYRYLVMKFDNKMDSNSVFASVGWKL